MSQNVKRVMTYDARGNGDGAICCSITGVHQAFISDYTAIVVEIRDVDSDGSGRSGRSKHSMELFGNFSDIKGARSRTSSVGDSK